MSEPQEAQRKSRRRSVWQTLAIYLAGAFFALEVVQNVVEAGNLPEWLPGMALILLIIGFPVVLTTAFLQSGQHGVPTQEPRQDAEPGAAQPTQVPVAHSLFTWRNAVLGGVGAFALWGVLAAVLMATGRAGGGRSPDEEPLRASIAVLPFASTRTDEQSESFTLGIHDDLLTQLSKVGSLRVISRTSVMEYRETTKNIREIGEELGVGTVLEGSIQRSGDRIHINAQLIDAATDEHLWADTYDRTLSVENVFHIQRELAEAIANELHTTLTPAEAASIDAAPTEDLEAYEYYLQGNVYFSRGPRSDDFEIAVDMYERAAELDPGFALAYARLALTHGFLFQLQGRDPESLAASKEAAERAVALDPDLPEGHLAMGEYYYWGPRDFERAIAEYDQARAAGLNTYDLHHALGAVRRRRGDFDGSIESFKEAIRLEPRSAHIHEDLGSTYQAVGRFAEAEVELTRAVSMAPDQYGSYWWLINTVLARDGETRRARDIIQATGQAVDGELVWPIVWFDFLDRDWQAVVDRTEGWDSYDRADALSALERHAEARAIWESNRAEGEEIVGEYPEYVDTDLDLATAYAVLGQPGAAHAEVARVRALVEGDAMDGPATTFSEVFVYARLGEVDMAFDALERLFDGLPHDTPPRYVALYPQLDVLREDPRWDPMMERYRQPPQ